MGTLKNSCEAMSILLPIAKQGALLFNIMCRQLGESSTHRLQNWKHFSKMYSEALSLYVEKHPNITKKMSSGDKGTLKEISRHLNEAILQDAFRWAYVI